LGILVFALLLHMFPLQAATPLSFEAASIKLNPELGPTSGGSCHGIDSPNTPLMERIPLGRCVFTRILGYHLVTYAYGLEDGPLPRNAMIEGVPDWFRKGIYDVNAKAEDTPTATRDQLLQMLRNLLVDRFKLRFHLQTKEVDGFSLVVDKSSPKFQLAKANSRRTLAVFPAKGAESGGTKNPPSFREIKAQKYSMANLVIFLAGFVGGPVVDKTGLEGDYDIDLKWDTENGPSLFTAIKEQLGLRLVPQKAPVEYLVIDSVERPTVN